MGTFPGIFGGLDLLGALACLCRKVVSLGWQDWLVSGPCFQASKVSV